MPDLIIKSLFGYGNFTSTDEVYTSLSLMVYALGIPAFMLIKIFAPFFFARQDIRTPLMVTVFTSFINILLTWYLLGVLGFIGIAYSLIISGWLNALILFVLVLLKKFYIPKLKTFIKILFIFLSTILMLLSLIALDSLFINFNENILKLILMIVVGTSTYLFSCYLLGLFKYLK